MWSREEEIGNEEYQRWLKSLKVGDKVAIRYGIKYYHYVIETISKINSGGRINIGDKVFSSKGILRDKFNVGVKLVAYTPEIEEEMKFNLMDKKIRVVMGNIERKKIRLSREQLIFFDNFFKEQGLYG